MSYDKQPWTLFYLWMNILTNKKNEMQKYENVSSKY